MKRISIMNGRLIDPASGRDEKADILIEDGIVKEIGTEYAPISFFDDSDAEIIDAAGSYLIPGLIDVHVHFRDPGYTYKEDIITGAAAAAAGGYTTVICMANTNPPIDNAEVLKELIEREKKLPIRVFQTANVSEGMKGEILTDMDDLYAAGAVGFTDDGIPLTKIDVLKEALTKAKKLNVPISLHEENPELILSLGINKGKASEKLGVGGAPNISEESMVERDAALNMEIGAKLDIQHVSSGGTVDIIRRMKEMGCNIYAEVTPQHLFLTEEAVLDKGSLAKVNPPLRTEEDRLKLIEGLKNGTIDMVATDHAPHSREEKAESIEKAPSGMIGLETALSLLYTNLCDKGEMSMIDMLSKLTTNPASLYGLPYGRIVKGGEADIAIFDPQKEWTVTEDGFHSRSSNSPFIGEKLKGKVTYTICRGMIVYKEGE